MKVFLFTTIAIASFFSSCKKKGSDAPYSYWQVNNDSFSTNNIDKHSNKTGYIFAGSLFSSNDGFFMNFWTGFYAEETLIIHSAPPANYPVRIGFTYKNVSYMPTTYNNTYITSAFVDGHIHYTVPPTWFLNYENVLDSVLVKGDFVLPN